MSRSEHTSYLTPKIGRPTRGTISEELGFQVPIRFAEFIGQIYDFAEGDHRQCNNILNDTLGIFPSGMDCRYAGTPPEMFPIGNTGCDGDHYGFLVLAPELKLDELPLVHYCPMDSDGVIVVGTTTEEGIAANMATFLSYEFIDEERKSLIREFATFCGIEPRMAPAVEICVPEGWRHLASSDGVGTLAPVEWFSADPLFDMAKWQMIEEYGWAADVYSKQKKYGTALHYLREGLWNSWFNKPFDLAKQMCDLYVQMDRQVLAEALDWTRRNRWERYSNED